MLLGLILGLPTFPATAAASEKAPEATEAPSKPNIVLITVECLRWDHLHSSGYPRRVMPKIEEFFKDGLNVDNVFSASSWTLPSLTSVFSSEYPFEHGVTRGEFQPGDGGIVLQPGIPKDLPWLPEILQKAGYQTFGFSSSPHTVRRTGFERGFDVYVDSVAFKQADEINDVILKHAEELSQASPFFLWIHYFDPHWQYWPKAPWINDYCPKPPELPPRLYDTWVHSLVDEVGLKKGDTLFEFLRASYDSEINFWDAETASLLQKLHLPKNTVYLRPELFRRAERHLPSLLIAFVASILLSHDLLISHVPPPGDLHDYVWVALAAMLPFFSGGLILTIIFESRRREISRLYFFDMAGAALGAVLVLPMISFFNGPPLLYFLSAVLLGSALVLSILLRRKICGGIALLGLLILAVHLANAGVMVFRVRLPERKQQRRISIGRSSPLRGSGQV